MLVTLILRLVPESLVDGQVVGEVEHVGGGLLRVNGVDELVKFAREAAVAEQVLQPPS